jgi:thioredoxin:protein disulfide reductase
MPYDRVLGFVTLLLSLVAGAPALAVGAGVKPADQAFQLHVEWDDNDGVRLGWSIAPGYYLYRDKIRALVQGRPARVETEHGELKDDPNFGPTEIYHQSAAGSVASELLPAKGTLIVTYQGCGENTICYPPITKAVDLTTLLVEDAPEGSLRSTDPQRIATQNPATTSEALPMERTGGGELTQTVLLGGNLLSTLVAFVGFGILLSFTPCVFPMIPIISGILARSGSDLSLRRSFALSATYVLGMATAYGTLGIFAAWAGENLQAVLQIPTAIVAVSIIFVLLALSMFGLYELQLPQSWMSKIAVQPGERGSLSSAAIFGFGSALIVGPCVTPPLAAALLFVAQTGRVIHGSLALFALGLGMGLPLIGLGVVGARVLPHSGPWLTRVKHVFGFVFIALAVWMMSRIVPIRFSAATWALLFLAIGAYFVSTFAFAGRRHAAQFVAMATGALVIVYGGVLAVGAATNTYDALAPLAAFGLASSPTASNAEENIFHVVSSEADLDDAIDIGRRQGKAIMIDFSAEWCTECKLMERNVLSQDVVRQKLHSVLLVRADLTHFDSAKKNLLKRFGVVGPPTIVFLNPDGTEVQEARIVGDLGITAFLGKLAKVLRT